MTIYLQSKDKVHVVDGINLKLSAFDTAGSGGQTLRNILESKQ